MNCHCGQRCCTPLLYAACKRPVPRSEPAAELGALEGIRTPNLLIRRSGQVVQDRPYRSWAGPIFQSCPRASGAVQRLGYSLGYSRGATALILDCLLFRPDVSPSRHAKGRASNFPDCGSFRIIAGKDGNYGGEIPEVLTRVPGRSSPDGSRNLSCYSGCGTGAGDQRDVARQLGPGLPGTACRT